MAAVYPDGAAIVTDLEELYEDYHKRAEYQAREIHRLMPDEFTEWGSPKYPDPPEWAKRSTAVGIMTNAFLSVLMGPMHKSANLDHPCNWMQLMIRQQRWPWGFLCSLTSDMETLLRNLAVEQSLTKRDVDFLDELVGLSRPRLTLRNEGQPIQQPNPRYGEPIHPVRQSLYAGTGEEPPEEPEFLTTDPPQYPYHPDTLVRTTQWELSFTTRSSLAGRVKLAIEELLEDVLTFTEFRVCPVCAVVSQKERFFAPGSFKKERCYLCTPSEYQRYRRLDRADDDNAVRRATRKAKREQEEGLRQRSWFRAH
jgi:hypothetical protein